MKTIVQFIPSAPVTSATEVGAPVLDKLEFNDVENINFSANGAIVLTNKENQPVGVFMPHAIAGIYHPEGRDKIIPVAGSLIVQQ